MRGMRRVRSQNGHAHRQDDDVQHQHHGKGFPDVFHQVVYSMRQMAMAPIRVPLVG